MNDGLPVRLNMIIRGNVQRVGYRHIVQGIARKHHITGTIRNLEGYDVSVIAEGVRSDLARFKDAINIQEYPVSVESIELTEEPPTGEFSYFQVIRGSPEDELAERFDSAIAIFSRMEKKQDQALEYGKETVSLLHESLGLHKKTIDLQEKTLGLQEKTIGLQEKTIGLQEKTIELQEKTLDLQEETLVLQKETLTVARETSTDVKGIRTDLNKTLTCEIAEMREELREIRSALIQAGILNIAHS